MTLDGDSGKTLSAAELLEMNVVRSVVGRLPHPLLCRLYHHKRLREESHRVTMVSKLTGLPLLETIELRPSRSSDTLFILGSAQSINAISRERWEIIGKHDSAGINFWPAHPFVPRFYHFENVAYDEQPGVFEALRSLLDRRAEAYADTLKIITEVRSRRGRQLVFEIPERMRKNLYLGFSMPVVARNEEEFRDGIRFMRSVGAFTPQRTVPWLFKYGGSVIAMMTLAVLMNYRRVVLCGIDLNRQSYFYQDRDLYPDYSDWEFVSKSEMHLTARRLTWLVPAQSAVHIFNELVLKPAKIPLFVESTESTLFPAVPLAPQSLFDELARNSPDTSGR